MKEIYMTPAQAHELGDNLRGRRNQLRLSAREVGRRAGLDVGSISRLEGGQILSPRPESLTAISRVLEIDVDDVLVFTDWFSTRSLPSFTPYLRSKYGDLPDDAVAELEGFFDYMRTKHGLTGPKPGEDET